MDLWEFNSCVSAYNTKCKAEVTMARVESWHTGNFVGAAFAGKLKSLGNYIKTNEEQTTASTPVSDEQMAAIDKKAKEYHDRRMANGTD